MSDFGTMAQQGLIHDCRDVAANLTEYKLNIIDSVVHHQPMRLWFQRLNFTIATKANAERYGLSDGVPTGAMYVEDQLWIDVDGDTNNRHQVVRKSPAYIELLRSGQAYLDWPEYFAIDGDSMMLWPGTDAGHTLRFRGIAKFPAPRKFYDADAATPAWVFPDGDDFTNEWFTYGERSVREYANYLRLGGPTTDSERARAALTRHLEALADLKGEHEQRETPPQTDGWPVVLE